MHPAHPEILRKANKRRLQSPIGSRQTTEKTAKNIQLGLLEAAGNCTWCAPRFTGPKKGPGDGKLHKITQRFRGIAWYNMV